MSIATHIAAVLDRARSTEQRWKVYVLLAVVVYFVAINQVIHIRPDHAFLALIVLAFLLGKERAKRFLVDWSPFILFWVAYDMMRGVADTVRGVIHISGPYRLELSAFGWLAGGQIPPFFLQQVRAALDGTVARLSMNLLSANLYTLHFAAPLVLGWVLWHTLDDRKTFYRLVYTLTLLNAMALITFMLYPAAPPWYVFHYGFVQPEPNSSYWGTSAGSLIDVDRLFGVHFFTTLWDSFNPNHFAAIPSLHGAYPLVISFFAARRLKRWYGLWIAYPALTWFAAVYLNQHYVIDLVIGGLYAAVAYAIVQTCLMPKVILPRIEAPSLPAQNKSHVALRRARPEASNPAGRCATKA